MTRIIFVYVGNSCRSQMAEGFAKYYAKNKHLDVEITSGGTRPQGYVHPEAIQVMSEKEIDISGQVSKGIKPVELCNYDLIISMGCSPREVCPVNFSGISQAWQIEDPFDQPIDAYRKTRDQIESRVKELLSNLKT